MRIVGLDLHRTFAEVAVLEEGRVRSAGRVELTAPALGAFARQLRPVDDVVLEATGHTHAVVRALQPYVRRVVVANPLRTRAIADAKIKTDKIDATVLAQLHASGFLPEVWISDERTEQVRRQVARRAQIVRHRTRLKNQGHAIVPRNLLPRCPAADLFGVKGRGWLATQPLPPDEQATVESLLRGRDHSWTSASWRPFGDVQRFRAPQKLVSYLGLNPRVRQSGAQLAQYGRITKQGRAHARGMLVEAAWVAAKSPGPLRAFFLRVRGRRGEQIAAVATARKLAVLVWHLLTKAQDSAWARPLLLEQKRRALELRAGAPAHRGRRGRTHAYSLKALRQRDRAIGEHAEGAYQDLVAHWRPQRPTRTRRPRGADAPRP